MTFQITLDMKELDAPCYVVHHIPSFETKKIACGTNVERDDRLFYYLIGRNAKRLDDNHWAYVDKDGEICSVSIVPMEN